MTLEEAHGKLLSDWASVANEIEDIIDTHNELGLESDIIVAFLERLLKQMKES